MALAELLPRLNAKGKLDMKKGAGHRDCRTGTGHARGLHEPASRAAALAIMGEWAGRRGVDPDLLSPTLYRYLAPACPVCDGLGKMRLPDAPGWASSAGL